MKKSFLSVLANVLVVMAPMCALAYDASVNWGPILLGESDWNPRRREFYPAFFYGNEFPKNYCAELNEDPGVRNQVKSAYVSIDAEIHADLNAYWEIAQVYPIPPIAELKEKQDALFAAYDAALINHMPSGAKRLPNIVDFMRYAIQNGRYEGKAFYHSVDWEHDGGRFKGFQPNQQTVPDMLHAEHFWTASRPLNSKKYAFVFKTDMGYLDIQHLGSSSYLRCVGGVGAWRD